jgi:hypothetical protein
MLSGIAHTLSPNPAAIKHSPLLAKPMKSLLPPELVSRFVFGALVCVHVTPELVEV